jgi:transcriptional regulator with XRE-family HTH domain
MNDQAVGRAIRAVRVKCQLRQSDLAEKVGISQQTVSRVETGKLKGLTVDTLRVVAGGLGVVLTIHVSRQGADLDRLLGARHSAMHELLAQMFVDLPGWISAPEVSFAIFGERGIVDILAWHEASRSLLVIEIKTELADIQETLGTLDRKIRLAPAIAKARGWSPRSVSAWLVIAEGTTNRARVRAHSVMLRNALPDDGPDLRAWLKQPTDRIRALSFLSAPGSPRTFAQRHRVRSRRRPPEVAA